MSIEIRLRYLATTPLGVAQQGWMIFYRATPDGVGGFADFVRFLLIFMPYGQACRRPDLRYPTRPIARRA